MISLFSFEFVVVEYLKQILFITHVYNEKSFWIFLSLLAVIFNDECKNYDKHSIVP